jgi:hypothetical protein
MRKFITFSLLFSFASILVAQDIQQIATGAGYRKQSYVNLSAGTERQVDDTAWDIAFTVFGQQDAGIFINESSGSSMGQPLAQVELWDAQTDDFNTTIDPALFNESQRLYNSEASWVYGGFNEVRDSFDAFDYGWGKYNFMTNSVTGTKVYVVKLRNATFRKIQIQSLIGTTYTFRYANLDGTNLQTKTINKADHTGKVLAYFNLTTGATADVEPVSGGFDFVYCRYVTELYDPGSMTFIKYNLTGILHGLNCEAVKAIGVDPATVDVNNYLDSFSTRLDVIGHEWKMFANNQWSVPEDHVYFLRTVSDNVWKIHFIDFEGSSTGVAVFEKTNLGSLSSVENPAAFGMKALMYPNPTQDLLHVALTLPDNWTGRSAIEVVDMQGRVVARREAALDAGFQVVEMPAATWTAGVYAVRMTAQDGRSVIMGQVVKQ